MANDTTPWRILVVDDEEGIHGITRMIFRGYEFEQRPIELISAMSGREARQRLQQYDDIAVILLDVVMETDNEGLQLVDHIRNELGNRDLRIILRTGHPGYAPEAEVIVNYDINDYLSKAELSASRLLTSVVVALRSYRDIESARSQNASSDTAPQHGDGRLLLAAGQRLSALAEATLRQGLRLQQFELNPMVQDLVGELNAHQQRLHTACRQLQLSDSQPRSEQPVELAALLDALLKHFLPQMRREGWLLDYKLSSDLPAQIHADPAWLQLLLQTALELAVEQADGADLKLQLNQLGNDLLISLSSPAAHPAGNDPWQQQLRSNLDYLCRALNGELLESDGEQLLRCRLPI
ncbi:response regulator [Marinobacterium arenosum]|uniref:response regulator n=1 Tax=Marinobacterium arenosum TaxID=2862496 RepID=UPI001C96A7FE|nr:response regulator [Marinobacterium arenosum]MBY4679023.1 response regulator [Marinobacterium arenosum]